MSDLLSADRVARDQAIDADGSVLVQAPAGSGKTTLLVQRYLRLLGRVEGPEQILALTFTRLAAQEMRERITGALRAAAQDTCPADLQVKTWELAVLARRQMERRQVEVERYPARMRIETIDSFNAWLSQQLPISAGAGGGLRIEDDATLLYQRAAERTLAHEANDVFGAAIERTLVLDDLRYQKLLELIARMLPTRDRWLPLLAGRLQATGSLDEGQLKKLRNLFDEDLAVLVSRALARAKEVMGEEKLQRLSLLIRGAADRLGDSRPEFVEWRQIRGELGAETADLPRWRALATLMLTSKDEFRKTVNAASGFPPKTAEKAAMQDILLEFAQDSKILPALAELQYLPLPKYSDAQWARVRDVAQLLVFAAAQLSEVFREAGAVDFPAVSLAALRALGSSEEPSDLALRLDYRLQHVLVDEFQDTSGGQLELLRLLTTGWQRGDGRSLFCVGDPMQSIYGFRQAEVRAFLELADEGIGDIRFEVQRLSGNFRSSKAIVDWTNRCFAQVLPRVDNRDRGAIAFRTSESARPAATGAEEPAVALTAYASRGEEAAAIADLIAERLSQRREWRVAILVRAKKHAHEIAAALRDREIEFHAVDIEPLQERAAVRDLIMLTRALLHLGDRIAWLAVLRGPWVGLCLADLWVLARSAAVVRDSLVDETALLALTEDGRQRCRKLNQILESAFQERGRTTTTRWVERTWLNLGGPSCVANAEELASVRTAFERLSKIEEGGLPDNTHLAERFAGLFATQGAAGRVEIMTIHKAKGLEFDCVILPALDRMVPRHNDALLLSHQFARSKRDGMVMAARPPVGSDKDPLFDFLRRQARDAENLEAQRLLYVACTRAKSELYLSIVREPIADARAAEGSPPDPVDDEVDRPPPKEWAPRSGSLASVLWPYYGQEFVMQPPRAGIVARVLQGGALRRVPSHWRPTFDHYKVEGTTLDVPSEARSEPPIFDWAGETARQVGSLVHAELQTLTLEAGNEASLRDREPHYRRWLALRGIPADRLREAGARVVSALIGIQGDPRGRWILQENHRDSQREQALSGVWRGEVVRVVFDRSFIDETGVRWVIDYKTSLHQGSGIEEFLDREAQRYQAQMERYAAIAAQRGPEPVRMGLYFPLMRGWREWAP